MIHQTLRSRTLILAASATALLTAGCSVKQTASITSTPGSALKGNLHGGQQPVSGGTIQLYAVGKTGYGSAATALIHIPVLTDAGGNFSITGDYTCSPGDLVYLVATGGNPGAAGVQNNSGLAEMTGLGPCSALSASTFIQVNELTTIASVYALAPFMKDLSHVGSTPTNLAGITNAFLAIDKLVNTSTGTAAGPLLPAGATLPFAEMNTLADILAACVNTVDVVAPTGISSVCATIFTDASTATSVPTDTIQVALNLAHNPTLSLTALNNMISSQAPFQPTLGATAPTSWTLAINYIGGGLSQPKAIEADASGNLWIPNAGNNSVTKLDTNGNSLAGGTGITQGGLSTPAGVAIDVAGDAWITNQGNNSVTKLGSTGSATAFTNVGLSAPGPLAIDAAGNLWIGNTGNGTISELSGAGVASSSSPYMLSGSATAPPVAIAINSK